MAEILKCFIKIFADDTQVYTAMQSDEHKRLLWNSVNQLVQRTKDWQIKFNNYKCKIVHVGKNNPEFKYFGYGWLGASACRGLKRSGSFRWLRPKIWTAYKFYKWDSRKSKWNIRHDQIRHYIQHKHKKVIPLFKSLVRPVLELYSNAVWALCLLKNITGIKNVQRHFTKCITGMNHLEYEQRLMVLKLPSLEYRRATGDMTETFKIIHVWLLWSWDCSLFKINEATGTRGHPFKLHKKTG